MKAIVFLALFLSSVLLIAQPTCVTLEEEKLYQLIIEYRKSKKLKPIPFSEKLTRVAQTHVRDLAAHFDYENRGDCNPHSWSDKGSWSACCYTADHKQAACMWSKPRELTGYDVDGYEIAYYSSGGATALEGLDGWKKSSGHNPLLINSGTWQKLHWKAIGVGIFEQYAVVWFGESEDPSKLTTCK